MSENITMSTDVAVADCAEQTENLLEISGLTKYYGAQRALNNVNLTLAPGRIAGLLGPNGSGKTTLIKIITGLINSYEGSVSVCGRAVGPGSKRVISYLPDRMALPEWLSVKSCADVYGDFFMDFDKFRFYDMIRTLNVPEKKKVSQLSKGMKEKLALILTMSRRAKLYIFDEPIAGVDPASREVVLKTILDNFSPESAILVSTHIISDVEQLFDDVIFLKEGEVNMAGDAETLRTQHAMSIDGLFREVYKCF